MPDLQSHISTVWRFPRGGPGFRHSKSTSSNRPVTEITTILTSPLQRARSTAQIIAAQLGCSLQIEEDLVEIDHGSWQGLTLSAIQSEFRDTWGRWSTRPSTAHVPGAETPEQVRFRMTRVLTRLEDPHLCLVSHGVALEILLTHLLGKPLDCFPEISLPNACLVHFQDEGRFDLHEFTL